MSFSLKKQTTLRFHENDSLVPATSIRMFPRGISQSGQLSPRTDTGTRMGGSCTGFHPWPDPELLRQLLRHFFYLFPPLWRTTLSGTSIHSLGGSQAGEAEGKCFIFQCSQRKNRTKPILLLGINMLQTHIKLKRNKVL